MLILFINEDPSLYPALASRIKAEWPGCEIVSAADSEVAENLAARIDFQCVFACPGDAPLTTTERLLSIPALVGKTVVASGSAEHAILATNFGALGYLTLPLEGQDFIRIQERLRSSVSVPERDLILLGDAQSLWPVVPDEIVTMRAEGSYTRLEMSDKRCIMLSRNLGDVEKYISRPNLIRANRSEIVNIRHVRCFLRKGSGKLEADLGDFGIVQFSRRQAQSFRSQFSA